MYGSKNGCRAIRYGDEMQCSTCGYSWELNDPDRPKCKTAEEINKDAGNRELDRIKTMLNENKARS